MRPQNRKRPLQKHDETLPAVHKSGAGFVVGKTSAVETAISRIKEGIREGRFAPGQRLIESDLQEVLGTSRGPIREAVRLLEAEGILELVHHKGARIRNLSREEVIAVYQIREVVEGLACRLAAENIDKGDNRKRFKALEAEFDRNYDGLYRNYLKYNYDFHRLIVEMSGNPGLIRLVEQLELQSFILLARIMVGLPHRANRARDEHRSIAKAVLAGDAMGAELAMRSHVHQTCLLALANAGIWKL